ncbi:MAG: FdtA/QdtA family cupin domain-containing protein [Patescibacteria group bacterium]
MKFKSFSLKTWSDERGDLTPIELSEYAPFVPQRIYYLTNTKSTRGGHAHSEEQELFVCIKGSFTAKIHDGKEWHTFQMSEKGECSALYNDSMVWHEFTDFSPDSVMLAVSSTHYNGTEGYIMDFEQFLALCNKPQ